MKSKTVSMAGLFSAVIVVLQLVSTFVKFGPVNITLALAPIIIGGALYGRRFSAFLGGVLGVFIALAGALGWDGGFIMSLAAYHPVIIFAVAILKTTVAGYLAGLIYEIIAKKNLLAAVLTSGVVCPVVNTGLFIVSMLVFFSDALYKMAGDTNVMSFIVFGLTGVNFIVELAVNVILAAAITRVIRALKKQ